MLYLDANILLRHLVEPSSRADSELQQIATDLLSEIERGTVEATFGEIVLQQVSYFLSSPNHYAMPASETVLRLQSIINLPGMRFADEDRTVFRRALESLESRPSIGLADYLILARAEHNGWNVVTFDRKLARLAGVNVWGRQSKSGD